MNISLGAIAQRLARTVETAVRSSPSANKLVAFLHMVRDGCVRMGGEGETQLCRIHMPNHRASEGALPDNFGRPLCWTFYVHSGRRRMAPSRVEASRGGRRK